MGAPVARMGRTPDPHPLHVHRPAKVVPVLRLLPPAPLPHRFAGRPAGRFCAVLLPSAIAHVGGENLPAGQALGLALVGHRSPVGTHVANPSSIPTNRPTSPPPTEGKAEENKILEIRCPKKTDRRMNSIFRLTDLHGNQLAADKAGCFVSDWSQVRTREMDWTALKLMLECIEPGRLRKRYRLPKSLQKPASNTSSDGATPLQCVDGICAENQAPER